MFPTLANDESGNAIGALCKFVFVGGAKKLQLTSNLECFYEVLTQTQIAHGRISDTDVAGEVALLVKQQILVCVVTWMILTDSVRKRYQVDMLI